MKIRMVQQMSGLRADRQPWPGPGAEFEVGDAEGAALAAQGIAVPVAAEERKAEARPAAPDPATETRAEPEPGAEAPKARVTGPRGPARPGKG